MQLKISGVEVGLILESWCMCIRTAMFNNGGGGEYSKATTESTLHINQQTPVAEVVGGGGHFQHYRSQLLKMLQNPQ